MAIVLFGFFAGCNTEQCFFSPTTVTLTRVSSDGGASTIGLFADATGRVCGCCGGRPPAQIVRYDWDFNGDGAVDQSGATLAEVDVAASALPTTVSVTVTDSDGKTAINSLSLSAP
jgi:hypothetical protein